MTQPKKLIEVALPLEAINAASAREKSIRHGHPSTLHLWWARRPLAAARAVIFAQMVDDPAAWPDEFPTEAEQAKERQRLFEIINELVTWENTTNEAVLNKARAEIWRSWRRTCRANEQHPQAAELFNPNQLPAFHDPFAGGGALPLEAQRLGLEAYASDLNPVAVMINKAMIEIPPKFAGQAPVNPQARTSDKLIARAADEWRGAQGLAEDVRYYGQWMRDEAEKRIGHLYPKIEVTADMVTQRPDLKPLLGKKLTVIAWLWARTVKSPNPAYAHVDVPLASTFMLSTKAGKEAYVQPVIENDTYRFEVRVGKPKDAEGAKNGTKLMRANFKCLLSGIPIAGDYIKSEGKGHRIGAKLMAIVAEGDKGRVYLSPTTIHEEVIKLAKLTWRPEGSIATHMTGGNCTPYGLTSWGDLFTNRQLVALTTFSDLVAEARERVRQDALVARRPPPQPSPDGGGSSSPPPPMGEGWGGGQTDTSLHDGGTGALAYAEAVSVYLAFGVDKCSDYWSSICSWHSSKELVRNTFGRQAIPMMWDYVETNFMSESTGNWMAMIDWVWKSLSIFPALSLGFVRQNDAQNQTLSQQKIISTDPPYYDNIGYADLSDFFYVWMRRSLQTVYPQIFATLAVPKAEELVATPYRHGGKDKAEKFFLDGMTHAMRQLAVQAHEAFPVSIYYAFKQSENDDAKGTTNTGWDTFLAAVIEAGFALTGTWPMRTELGNRMIGSGANALASSIVLVCRKRPDHAPIATRRQFLSALKTELPAALRALQAGNIAPVDLAQAAIGPGMAVFTRYAKVLDAQGAAMTVREALALINQTLDEVLAEQEGDFDADSRWALAWFEQSGFDEGEFGIADVLARAKNTSVQGLVEAAVLTSRAGKVRLLKPAELSSHWDPSTDPRLTAWEVVHQLIRVLEQSGEAAAAALVAKLGSHAETARELAYRLYTLCERKKRAQEALSYNALVQSWGEIANLAQNPPNKAGQQHSMDFATSQTEDDL